MADSARLSASRSASSRAAAARAEEGRPIDESERSIPFVMHEILNLVDSSVKKHARAYGLTIEGVRVLFRLLPRDSATVKDLARLTGAEISTLSRLLDRMGEKGLIRRQRDADDARSVQVSLTAKGRKLALQNRPVFYKDYERILLAGFAGRDAQQFRDALVRMLRNLRDHDLTQLDPPQRAAAGR
ncbi:MAG TPA: MarR family winged helix-turn-helix transcriptional regulator [Alphaproteobacteria bacterium]|jgi:DNA-binding MarR family transcriptional regulator